MLFMPLVTDVAIAKLMYEGWVKVSRMLSVRADAFRELERPVRCSQATCNHFCPAACYLARPLRANCNGHRHAWKACARCRYGVGCPASQHACSTGLYSENDSSSASGRGLARGAALSVLPFRGPPVSAAEATAICGFVAGETPSASASFA